MKLKTIFNRFIADESGQDLIEYALVAGFVSLAAVASLPTIASSIKTIFSSLSTQLSTAAGTGTGS